MSFVNPGKRCVCGYTMSQHDPITGKCPLCACGSPPEAHDVHGADRGCPCACGSPWAAHELGSALWEGVPCPGRRSKEGAWLRLRQGTFREPAAPAALREWHGMLVPVLVAGLDTDDAPGGELASPPQVPARPPYVPGEIAGAGGGKQATKLGRLAQEAGWQVSALYWRAGSGIEGCALRLARNDLRIVMTWKRPAGKVGSTTGWGADVAYAWRLNSGSFPAKLPHTQVEGLLNYGRETKHE